MIVQGQIYRFQVCKSFNATFNFKKKNITCTLKEKKINKWVFLNR